MNVTKLINRLRTFRSRYGNLPVMIDASGANTSNFLEHTVLDPEPHTLFDLGEYSPEDICVVSIGAPSVDQIVGPVEHLKLVRTYFILESISMRVKIGRSIDPSRRLHGLQTAHSSALELLGSLEGDLEREWHQEFASARVSGEWFALTDELANALQVRVGISAGRLSCGRARS